MPIHFLKTYRDSILALTGIVIATISLCLAIWQGNEQIRNNHISVEPRINAYFSNDGRKNQWGIYLINNGMGPAFVSGITATVDGKPVEAINNNIFIGVVQALGLRVGCFVMGGPRPNDSFKTREEIFLIEARDTDPECAVDRLQLMQSSMSPYRLNFTLDTESIYGDKFRYNFSLNQQEKR
ncbi:hypothetical protein IM880_13105 [Pectobacterium polaris]|uniref:Uncharacterized protein n=1 Tax=Pectobacterium polaris TaxID=2042057 RepID=A0AAW4P1E0_9GAMM|nr:hypothetical protein [Pectobacterium polaris]MBW5893152.1 hypothetical protein [Pectobacterium polaris]MCL6358599.1 hypothetical protein [Pectobacterium polaris]MCU1794224.1 hypothetical protein [Pectobacterium polaris]